MQRKIAFMGTPNFAVPILKYIYQNGYEIPVVYTQPPKKTNRGQKIEKSSIHLLAETLNLNIRTPNQLNKNNLEYEYLRNLDLDLVIVVAYGQIIPDEMLGLTKKGFINIHASLLPSWRGAAPIQRSIMNLDKETGVSIMKIVEKLDSGPVMKQQKIEIKKNTNAEELLNQLSYISSKLILESIDEIESGNAQFIDQNEKESTYAKKIEKKESKINWQDNAIKILAKINSLYPNPGAWFTYMGERYKILKASLADNEGKIAEVLDNDLTVACRSKSIKIIEIQRQGKNKQNSSQFLLGSKIKKGSILN